MLLVLECNLLAMGFEKSSEGAVAKLPTKVDADKDTHVDTSSTVDTEAKPTAANKVSAMQVGANCNSLPADVVHASSAKSSGLYGLVKEQVIRSSSSNVDQPSSAENVRTPVLSAASKSERQPRVYFCETKNTVLSISNADSSVCR